MNITVRLYIVTTCHYMSTWSSEFCLVCLNLNSEPRYLASWRWCSHPPVTEPKVDKGWRLIHSGADVFFPCYNHIMMIQNENLTCLLQAAENKCLTLPHQPTRAWNESRFNMIHNTNLHIFPANPPILNSELRAIAAEPAARAWQDSFGWVEGWIWINNIHVMCQKMSKTSLFWNQKQIPTIFLLWIGEECLITKRIMTTKHEWTMSRATPASEMNWALHNLTSVPGIHLNIVDLGATGLTGAKFDSLSSQNFEGKQIMKGSILILFGGNRTCRNTEGLSSHHWTWNAARSFFISGIKTGLGFMSYAGQISVFEN